MKEKNTKNNCSELIKQLREKEKQYTLVDAKVEVKKIVDIIPKEEIKLTDRLCHSFFYEICPIITIATHIQDNVKTIEFCAEHEEFDAKIHLNTGNTKKVELTRDLNKKTGENEARRIRLLRQTGRAPAFGKICARYEKREEIFEDNPLITRQIKCDPWYQEISNALNEAYERKQKEKYKGCWLGISFNDRELSSPSDKRYYNIPCNQFWKSINQETCPFERIFIIGDSCQFIWDSWDIEKKGTKE